METSHRVEHALLLARRLPFIHAKEVRILVHQRRLADACVEMAMRGAISADIGCYQAASNPAVVHQRQLDACL
jgi:hypothetical protein